DDVMNKQREIIYDQRRQVLDGRDLKETILNMMRTSIENHLSLAFGAKPVLDADDIREALKGLEGMYFLPGAVKASESMDEASLTEACVAAALETYERKEREITPPIMREIERVIMLRVVDEYWMDHIDAMDDLKQGIRLQAYGNNDPVDAYKRESLQMFEEMISAIQDETVRRLYAVQVRKNQEVRRERVAKATSENVGGDGSAPKKQPKKVVKIGRNDPCPCGSGKKWKKCTCAEYHPDLKSSV
ncbi:MAG: SEC-C domain-containing protein, partial [Oscillibacter sp.]|nr:SEC-C domain-containing protein [Oscillibacter sp.]